MSDPASKQEQAKLIDEILSASPDSIYIYDRDLRFIYVNLIGAEMLGLGQPEIIGKTWQDLGFPEDILEPVKVGIFEVLETGKHVSGELKYPTVFGLRDFDYTITPLFKEDGKWDAALVTARDITEHKRIEADVLESRRQVTDILNSISDGFFALDTLWRITYVNKKAEELLLKSKIELLFKNLWEVFPEAAGSTFYKEYYRARETMQPTTFQEFYPPLNKWFEVHAYPYEGGLSVYFEDISARVKAEQLSDTLNLINADMRSTLDFDEIMKKAVSESAEALGVDAAGISLLEDTQLVVKYVYGLPEDLVDFRFAEDQVRASLQSLESGELVAISDASQDKTLSLETVKALGVRSLLIVPLVIKQEKIGIIHLFSCSAQVKFTEDQIDFAKKLGVSVSLALENARLFEKTKQSEERFRATFEQAAVGIAHISLDYRFININQRFADITGYSKEELLRKAFIDITYPEDIDKDTRQAQKLYKGDTSTYSMEKRYIRKDGSLVWVNLTGSLARDESGAPQYFIAVIDDITEHKQAEEELMTKGSVLEGISEILGKALTSKTEEELGNACLTVAERVTQSKFGFVGEIGPDGLLHDIAISNPGWHQCAMHDKTGHRHPLGSFKLYGLYGHVLITGKSFFTNDPSAHPESIGLPEGHPPLNSFLGAPLISEGKIIGMVAMANREGGYTQEQLEALEMLSPVIVEAFKNKRSEDERKQALEIFDLIIKASDILARSLDLQEVLNRLADIAAGATNRTRIYINLIDRKTGELEIMASKGAPTAPVGQRFKLGKGIPHITQAVKSKRLLIADYDSPDIPAEAKKFAEKLNIKLLLIAPIVFRDKVIGTIGIDEPGIKRDFIQRDIVLVEGIASQAAIAIENARLFQAERDTAKTLEAITERTNAQIAYLDTDMNFVFVNSAYIQGSGCTREELIGRNHFELFPNEENETIFKRVRDTGEAVEYRAKPFEYADQPWRGTTYWDWTLTPVKDYSGHVIGLVLSLVDITPAIRSKQLSDALNDINAAISSTLNAEEIMRKAMVEGSRALGTDASAIYLRESGYWVLKHAHSPTHLKEPVSLRIADEQAKTMALAASTSEPVVVNDAKHDERVNQELIEPSDIASFVHAPLIVRGNVFGLITYSYLSTPVAFTEAQVDFVRKLATSASLAIENARLYEAERNIADVLQGALLTVPENIKGVGFGHLYRSATEAAKVGGDFYDIFAIEHEKIGVLIGDVSGKGINAAAITATVKNAIKAHTFEDGDPCAIVSKTNDLLVKVSQANIFVTLFFGVLDTKTGELLFCSAGHPPAIIRRSNNVIDTLEERSPVIGAFRGLQYSNGRAMLMPEDILILYTDGVTEARCNGAFFGEKRLLDLVKEIGQVSVEQVPGLIFDEVLRCSDGNLSDDLAMLTVSLKAE